VGVDSIVCLLALALPPAAVSPEMTGFSALPTYREPFLLLYGGARVPEGAVSPLSLAASLTF
jgi:hypothetical protein